MVDAWPSTLPQVPIKDGLSEQRQPNVAAFKPDVGPPKYRRRSSAAVTIMDAAFIMKAAQVADFNEFYETTLADGSLPFEWDHPLTGVTYLWCFDSDQVPQFSPFGSRTQVKVRLLRLP